MYRVVLVDDEAIILEGLRRVVKWADHRCEVVGTASDAAQGAALIRQARPDILFTDIRMPNQNGLAMVAGLRSEFPDLQVTVLTGFRDFAYAQEAIRLGVVRFLLKPSKMDEIEEAVAAMVARLDQLPPREEAEAAEQQPELDPESEDKEHASSFLVNQAIAYMKENYQQKLTLQDVADCCFVSQWHLSKLLNRYAGKSFYDILNSIRIEAAKELLQNPSLKIGDVSEMVGYMDTAHFARTFKKITGMSANEFRNSLK